MELNGDSKAKEKERNLARNSSLILRIYGCRVNRCLAFVSFKIIIGSNQYLIMFCMCVSGKCCNQSTWIAVRKFATSFTIYRHNMIQNDKTFLLLNILLKLELIFSREKKPAASSKMWTQKSLQFFAAFFFLQKPDKISGNFNFS